jgi:hypothetical protein
MGKGGGSPPPQPTQVSQLTIPEYAQPYMEKLLGRSEALTGKAIPTYDAPRIAQQGLAQREVQQAVRGMQLPRGFGTAEQMAIRTGQEALARSQYAPGQFGMATVQGPGPIANVRAPMVQQFGMQGAQTGFRPSLQNYQTGFLPERGTPFMGAAQTGFRPELSTPAMFGQQQAQAYMSPYMQSVVDVQKRKAIEDAQLSQLGANLAAPRQGTYGGARQLLAQTQREKALAEGLGDIQARGLQSSFEQAQQQFERDRSALMQTEALRTDVGLKTALSNLDARQQANVQNQAAQLQTQGLNADQALRVALANQQAALGVQQLGTEAGLKTSLANLDAEQQARVQNLAASLQTQGLSSEQALKAALANQQQYGQFQELSQRAQIENQRQFAEMQKMAEQSRQFAGELGLRGVDLFGGAGRDVAGIAGQQMTSDIQRRQLQSQTAEQERIFRQAEIDAEIARFQEQQAGPYKQLGFMSDILRGTGSLAGGRAIYEAPQSFAQQAVGVGLPALALARGLG